MVNMTLNDFIIENQSLTIQNHSNEAGNQSNPIQNYYNQLQQTAISCNATETIINKRMLEFLTYLPQETEKWVAPAAIMYLNLIQKQNQYKSIGSNIICFGNHDTPFGK